MNKKPSNMKVIIGTTAFSMPTTSVTPLSSLFIRLKTVGLDQRKSVNTCEERNGSKKEIFLG